MASIHNLLNQLSSRTRNNRDKGSQFERLMAQYLKTDPQYADRLTDVWLWSDWPDHEGNDVGIDLIAKEKDTGEYWAIQCKYYDPHHSLQKSDIDSFFTASGKSFKTPDGKRHSFSQRVIISTTDKWGKNAEAALRDQTIPVTRIWFKDLENSPIDWEKLELSKIKDLHLKPKKTLQEHQSEAISSVLNGLKDHDRGKLVMACGTGKTFTSLRLMEQMVPKDGKVLFLAPSISLISQTLREWTAEAINPIHAFVVCSDTKVGKEEEDIPLHDLAYPATTNAEKLVQSSNIRSKDRPTVIFSTYQSIQVIADAQKKNFGEFDLIICDEAHRTTGFTLPDQDPSDFLKIHDNNLVRGRKRIYMTATPRIYCDSSKTRANESAVTLFSMDDETHFGKELYRLGFGKAVERNLLTDYKVLIVAVKENEMAKLTNIFNAYKFDEKKAIDVNFATKIIGCWKGIAKGDLVSVSEGASQQALTEDVMPMRRVIAFSRTIKDSKQKVEIFSALLDKYYQLPNNQDLQLVSCAVRHIDGSMNSQTRKQELDWLKEEADECRILSNARCLSEGIDVPALDAVVFFDTRESMVDIVQSVGRVMRKSDGKKYGYIILPVCIPSEKVKDYNDYIEHDPQFKSIWKVIKALRAHDESLVDEAQFRQKIQVIGDNIKRGSSENTVSQLPLNFPDLPLDAINDAVYAAIPQKLGDREYWGEWAKNIGQTAQRLIARINDLVTNSPDLVDEFSVFHKGLQDTLNPSITKDDAIEMLAQHILTLPVFKALFGGEIFPENNVVAKALDAIVKKLETASLGSETESLEKFYASVVERISYAKSDKSKQDIVRNLYDTFFQNAFPRMSERLGIVYTPVPVVDFIINSVQMALKRHFDCLIGDRNVHILDPFCGTGTFLVRLIQSGLIDKKHLLYKYSNELHANEIILLAYYIATINIEIAFHAAAGNYRPFNGMVLADTFQMTETEDNIDTTVLPENNKRAEQQLKQPIKVILGNPPYSAQQKSQNYNNQNISYPDLDRKINKTYAMKSNAQQVKNLYDSYIRAIRWASDRISDNGIIAFVTNGSFIDANNMDGLRKSLIDDFSCLYVFNLRGNARTQGEERRREGGGVFGEGSRTPVAITIMIKDTTYKGCCELFYHDIGDYLTRSDKFEILEKFRDINGIKWQKINPNKSGDWINQRNPIFEQFILLGNKNLVGSNSIFNTYSQGVLSARDWWVYNSSKNVIDFNVRRMIDTYNSSRIKYFQVSSDNLGVEINIEKIINTDSKQISWSRALKRDAKQNKDCQYEPDAIVKTMYRPFFKQWMYFNRRLNEMVGQMFKLFPTPQHHNIIISVTGIGANKPFSAFITNVIPDYEMMSKSQCFALYWYEKIEKNSDLTNKSAAPFTNYIRHDTISDWALQLFRSHYQETLISKEDIFWYVYGILHSTEYKQRFFTNLKKMLARIPLAKDFYIFCNAGRKLGELHLNYESLEPFPLSAEINSLEDKDFIVKKMTFGKKDGKTDKSNIIFNSQLSLKNIPLEAYDYVVNGKPAIEWIMERYQTVVDKESGITNDPNQWSDDPRYIFDLVRRIVRVSIESMKIIKNLPPLNEAIDDNY
ncbi:type ISP restriction/modification enzyme [Legionella pneumophila serogroup 1]